MIFYPFLLKSVFSKTLRLIMVIFGIYSFQSMKNKLFKLNKKFLYSIIVAILKQYEETGIVFIVKKTLSIYCKTTTFKGFIEILIVNVSDVKKTK